AIAGITEWWLEHDPGVFVLGEEVGHMKGGAYQATKGLAGRYPGRVRDTPISEAGFSGVACGAAMSGLRPIVEIMFPDFALVAADQVFNQIGKLRHMYGGRAEIPLVMRTRIAIGCGYGGQHSGDPVALFALCPGWTVVAPVTPFDYVGLFNAAMRRRDPVLIVEHHTLYDTIGPVPGDFGECYVRIGSAKRLTEGADATVLAYASTVPLALGAAEELAGEGIDAEVIDLRTLSMPDIDYGTIGESLRKTGRMVVVEQAPASNSIGARIAGECQRRFFDLLDGPVLCVTGADVPYPVSRALEAACVPGVGDVRRAVSDLVEGRA
ncbi:MAG: alpha-ketoacid dehydrogenase subunit beta, partial [Planctomycetota bacterium]